MKKIPQVYSTIIFLIVLSIIMITLIVIFITVNPANKPITELVPAIIICSIILVTCLVIITYFVISQKTINKINYKNNETAQTINVAQKYFHNTEEILWEGQSSKKGSIMFSIKICLFLIFLYEIIFIIIAIFFDIGLSNRLKTFIVLQICLLMPCILFFLMCFQAMHVKYRITNKRVYIYSNFNKLSVIYHHKDILDLKIKYAFFEKDKHYGTIKIKVRHRKLTSLKNHLYSIPEPEKVFTIIKNCISNHIT